LGSLPRKGLKEAGSLGEARQVPLSPVGNPAENNTIARPGEKSPRANIGSGEMLVDLSKFAQQRFSRMSGSPVAL